MLLPQLNSSLFVVLRETNRKCERFAIFSVEILLEILLQIFIFDHEKLLDEDAVTKK